MPFSNEGPGPRKLVMMSLMVALSMGLHFVESTLSLSLAVPGVKLGLANIVTLICLYILAPKETLMVVLLRVVMVGLVSGQFFMPVFWISLTGALASFLMMALAKKSARLTPVGVSLLGAAAHNTGQLAMVAFLIGSLKVAYYWPWLMLWAIPMGLLTGFSAKVAIKALRNTGVNVTMNGKE